MDRKRQLGISQCVSGRVRRLKRAHIELVFEGLDGPADVYLNDKQILTANNAFREFRVDVKPLLKSGANQLRVVFPSPITAAQKIAAKDIWQQQTKTPEESYLRKAAYEYGWDWGRRSCSAESGSP